VVCSVNDTFLINCSCVLIVKAREKDSDIVCNFERPWFVTLCYDCEHVLCSGNDHFPLLFLVY
jgi:hypothetical protein